MVSANCIRLPASIGEMSLLKESCGSGQLHNKMRACIVGKCLSLNKAALPANSAIELAKVVSSVGSSLYVRAPVATMLQKRTSD